MVTSGGSRRREHGRRHRGTFVGSRVSGGDSTGPEQLVDGLDSVQWHLDED
ncbi:hypothetical protein PI124_g21990 [Phytophthora idaei]|nr:hypothetical protein PI126_g21794 [Phytophthora idaei]KAG3232930.1 hypothetical protein PI124_g21990 [Phytophthora idaei]